MRQMPLFVLFSSDFGIGYALTVAGCDAEKIELVLGPPFLVNVHS